MKLLSWFAKFLLTLKIDKNRVFLKKLIYVYLSIMKKKEEFKTITIYLY